MGLEEFGVLENFMKHEENIKKRLDNTMPLPDFDALMAKDKEEIEEAKKNEKEVVIEKKLIEIQNDLKEKEIMDLEEAI